MTHLRHIITAWSIAPLLLAAGFVYETETEFTASGDFDGDGLQDVVVVDRETGAFRIGYQTAGTNMSWSASRVTGIDSIESVGIGRVLSTNADAVVAASAAANRINVVAAEDRNAATTPVPVFVDGIGPSAIAAADIGGPGNTAHDDLLAESVLNGTAPYAIHTVRSLGTNLSDIASSATNAPWSRANSVTIKSATPRKVAVLEGSPVQCLSIYDLSSGAVSQMTSTAVSTGSVYAVGRFAPQPCSQFLAYQPGASNFVVHPVTEAPPGTYAFGAAVTVDLAVAIGRLVVMEGPATNHLLVLSTDGSASLYAFDGSNAPALLQTEQPASGMVFSAAAPIGFSSFVMLQADGNGPSRAAAVYTFNGSTFDAGATSALPTLRASDGNANALLFEAEPFVSFTPGRVSSFRVGDWTDQVSLTGTPANVSVDYELDSGLVTGLQAGATASLGRADPRALYGLASQAGTNFSVFSFETAIGAEVSEVTISPAPGLYAGAVHVSFTNRPVIPIYYRASLSNAWTVYSAPFYLFADATVYYYAQISGSNTKSRVRSAAYTFTKPPATLDADRDGVPDYVEIVLGLDPSGSGQDGDSDGLRDLEEILAGTDPTAADSDSDGYDDLTELRGGTDPNNGADVPVLPITNDVSRLEQYSVFDLVLTPRPYDGVVSNVTLATTGTALRAYSLGGSILAYGPVTNQTIPGVTVTNPAGILAGIDIDVPLRLVAGASEEHFGIATTHTNALIGRELVGLYDAPTGAEFVVDYTYANGEIGTEATNWMMEARTACSNVTPAVSVFDLGVTNTLVALLFEREVGNILYSRGSITGSLISIFPFRQGDADLEQPALQQIVAIGTGAPLTNAYNVLSVFTNIREQVRSSLDPDVTALRGLATEIYRISSAFNDGSPGTYDLPVDVLRAFLAYGALDPAYTNVTAMDTNTILNAAAGVSNILASIQPRPTATYTVEVRTNSFEGEITTLWTVGTGIAKNLYNNRGGPFWFPATFDLIPGTEMDVTGYTDITGQGTGDPIEVISISLTAIPVPSRSDADGNLMPDTWELLVFGATGNDPSADSDTDGYSDLQEYLDGTDPLDDLSIPTAYVDLSAPRLTLTSLADANVDLEWVWPAAYQDEFAFGVQSTEDLGTSFTNRFGSVSAVSSNMTMQVPLGTNDSVRFYRLILSLETQPQ